MQQKYLFNLKRVKEGYEIITANAVAMLFKA